MATITKSLVPGSQLTTSTAIYYTVPASTKAIIKQMTVTNTTAGAVTYTIHLVNDAGAPTAPDQLITGSLAPSGSTGSTVVVGSANGHVLETGYTIQALSNTATAVTLKVSGLEVI